MKTQNQLRFAFGKFLALAIGCSLLQSVHAAPLFDEGFNYPSGSHLGGNMNPGNSVAWSGSGTNLEIGSGNLTYSGLNDLGGNDLVVTSGTSVSGVNSYSTVTSGSIYYSFLLDCTTVPTGNQAFSALENGSTSPQGSSDPLAIYTGASGGSDFQIGIRTSGGGSGAVYVTGLSLNTTYLVVSELTFGLSDTVNLYIDPTPGGSQPITPDATQTSSTSPATSANNVGFKAQSNTAQGDFIIDNVMIGTTWADVTPAPEPSTLVLAGLGLLGLVARVRRVRR